MKVRPELVRYLLLARAHGRTLREYLDSVTSRELAQQAALERVVGPLGEDRLDWRFAWLASWQLAKRDEETVTLLYHHLVDTIRRMGGEEADANELIDDDPEASAERAQQLTQQVLALFPKPDSGQPADTE